MATIEERYQFERDRIETARKLDWSSFEPVFIVAGETIKPMTVRTWFDLLAIKSPILYSETPTVEAIVDYVWRHSVRNTRRTWLKHWRLFWLELRVERNIQKKKTGVPLMEALLAHLEHSLEEFPSDMNSASVRRKNSMSAISSSAGMLDEIAERYSMNPETVLDMPLRRAFALQRIIRTANIPNYKPLEPESLRAIKSAFLTQQNNGKK